MIYWCGYVIFRDTFLYEMYDRIVPLMKEFFLQKSYGNEVKELRTDINCSPGLDNSKQRVKFRKKEGYLYFDVMLKYYDYIKLTNAARKNYIAECILRDMESLRKFKPKGFILDDLKRDFIEFFQSIEWLLPDE